MLSCGIIGESYNNKHAQNISFGAFRNPIKPSKKFAPFGIMQDISESLSEQLNIEAYRKKLSTDAYIRTLMKNPSYMPSVMPVESKSVKIGNTRLHSLIDGEQIFNKTLEYIKSAKKSIQIEMFEFQNLTVDGNHWATSGAKKVPGAKEQQQILGMLLKKKQANPEMKIQLILDAHKWYMDSHGKTRHYNNQDMIRFLKQKGIDVVPYPKTSRLQHIKLMVVDGEKAILGGMNWGTHSAANHDACVALENLPNKKSSEIDNLLDHHFNPDWALAWKQIGETRLVNGPVTKEEQQFYQGLNKEIKQENVDFVKLIGEFYNTPEAMNRYKEGRLDLSEINPLDNPAIKVLGTKPRELAEVGKQGDESTREYLMDKIKTCKKLRAELFVLTDKELVATVSERIKRGNLDAQFVISSELLKFPYCRMAYHELLVNKIPVRVYKTDKSTSQRLHSKWAVFDDKEVLIGSTNWSGMGLNQNLAKGFREDHELNSKKIMDEIKEYLKEANAFEKELGIPLFKDISDYPAILQRKKELTKVINEIEKTGKTSMNIGGKAHDLDTEDLSTISTIQGYYTLIKKRYNAKEKYKRGNNELSIVFSSPLMAKSVFQKQFDRDWVHSESKFDRLKQKIWPIRRPAQTTKPDIGPDKLDIEG